MGLQGVLPPLPLPASASAKPCVNNISQTVLVFSNFFLPFIVLTYSIFTSILAVAAIFEVTRQPNSAIFFHHFHMKLWSPHLQ